MIDEDDDGARLGTGELINETQDAILVQLDGASGPLWVPKSQLHDDSEIYGGDDGEGQSGQLVTSTWWAEKRGLA